MRREHIHARHLLRRAPPHIDREVWRHIAMGLTTACIVHSDAVSMCARACRACSVDMLAVVVDGDGVRVIARTRARRGVSMSAAVRDRDGVSMRSVASR